LADFLPTITIKAKDFANEITNTQVKQQDLRGESSITQEHVKNNRDVRKTAPSFRRACLQPRTSRSWSAACNLRKESCQRTHHTWA
jgi:hypothetical protein